MLMASGVTMGPPESVLRRLYPGLHTGCLYTGLLHTRGLHIGGLFTGACTHGTCTWGSCTRGTCSQGACTQGACTRGLLTGHLHTQGTCTHRACTQGPGPWAWLWVMPVKAPLAGWLQYWTSCLMAGAYPGVTGLVLLRPQMIVFLPDACLVSVQASPF